MEREKFEDLFNLSRSFIKTHNRVYRRYFLQDNSLENRFSIIIGQRGVGKTTLIIQFLTDRYPDLLTDKTLYIPADHFLVGSTSLFEIAESFSMRSGELLCIDEIHKYPEWSRELKSIYDSFPNIKIIATGSSALEIAHGTHDLSRRAIVYHLHVLSFREYIGMSKKISFAPVSLKELISGHERYANDIIEALDRGGGLKILPLFDEYLRFGLYPYFLEYNDRGLYYITIEQNMHTTIESDLTAIYPTINGAGLKKIKKLLSIIAASVPFKPDLKKLKTLLDIGDERTLKTYLRYLEDAGIIMTLGHGGKGLKALEKPEKIYLNNTNQMYSLKGGNNENTGNMRETFFLCATNKRYAVTAHNRGDFLIDEKYLFEVGGKKKGFSQIKDIEDSYLALDDIETGIGNRIPLWLFGFLY